MKLSRNGRQLVATNIGEQDWVILEIHGFKKNEYGAGFAAPYTESLLADVIASAPTLELDEATNAMLQPSVRWKNVKGITLPSKRISYPYQQVGARLLLQQEKFCLAWEVGVGKTKPIIDVATYLMKNGDCDLCVVFSEPSVAAQWANKAVGDDSDLDAAYIWANTGLKRRQMLRTAIKDGVKFIVLDYYCARVEGFLAFLSRYMTSRTIVVLDECQNIKDTKTDRFKQFYRLIKSVRCKYVWGATGSPISQALEDWFGQGACIDERVFGPPSRYFSFRAKHLSINPNNKHHVVGYRAVPEFMQKFHSMAHRLRKEDVVKDLPPLTFQDIELEMPADLRKIYEAFVDSDGVLTLPGKTEPELICEFPLTRMQKARQICQGFYYHTTHVFEGGSVKDVRETRYVLGADWHNPKLDVLDTYLQTGVESIVWYAYVEEMYQLIRHFEKKGYDYLRLSRDVPNPQRHGIVDEYQRGKGQILLSQPGIGGVGLNIQRARMNFFYGHQSRVIKREQAEGRSHRAGVKHGVTIVDLSWAKSAERVALLTVRAKRELSRLIVDTKPEDFRKLLKGELTV